MIVSTEEKNRTGIEGRCCPFRMTMKNTSDPGEVLCSATNTARLIVTQLDEIRMGHDVYRKVFVNRGQGLEPVPLPSLEYIDILRLKGAFAHYPFNQQASALVLPRCSYQKKGFVLYTRIGTVWTQQLELPAATRFIGVSLQDEFIFINDADHALLFLNAAQSSVAAFPLNSKTLTNAHLAPDRKTLLIEFATGDSQKNYELWDLGARKSIVLQPGPNTDSNFDIISGGLQFSLCCEKGGGPPLWGDFHIDVWLTSAAE